MATIFGNFARQRPEMYVDRAITPPWVLSALGLQPRLVFASVRCTYFLISAAIKIGGKELSKGPDVAGNFLPLGAFYSLVAGQLGGAGGDQVCHTFYGHRAGHHHVGHRHFRSRRAA